ncbi:MAG: radical SAM protein, partial [Eubacteriales bacterium]
MQSSKNNAVLDYTESVCPVCLKVLEAKIVVKDKAVYMEKECPEHGFFSTYVWPDVDHYNWIKNFKFP